MQPLQLGISRLALIVASEKGGVRKTATAAVLHDYWEESGFDITLVQVDKQGRLDALFPERVTTIDMPTTADMRADDLANARALAPALDILLSPNPGVRIFESAPISIEDFLTGRSRWALPKTAANSASTSSA